jgi:hypothetical protein
MSNEEHVPHLPSPSIWPVTIGLGVTLMAFGVPTSLYLSAVGAIMVGLGLRGWIQELRHG